MKTSLYMMFIGELLFFLSITASAKSYEIEKNGSCPKMEQKEFVVCSGAGFLGVINENLLRLSQEAHFNVVGGKVPKENRDEIMNLAQQYGLRILINDWRLRARFEPDKYNSLTDFLEKFKENLEPYLKYPNLYGFYYDDEPKSTEFPSLAAVPEYMAKRHPNLVPFVNLLPNYSKGSGNQKYRDHIREYIRIVKPSHLSFDNYTLFKDTLNIRKEYFENFEIIQEEAARAGIPFSYYAQTTEHYGYRDVTPRDIRWQVNVALLYGARGIRYFQFWSANEKQKSKSKSGWELGIIRSDGTPTEKYDAVKRINGEIKRLSPILMDLTLKSVWHNEPYPQGTKKRPKNDPFTSLTCKNVAVSHFVDSKGEKYTMLFNRSFGGTARVTATFAGTKATWELLDPDLVEPPIYKRDAKNNQTEVIFRIPPAERYFFHVKGEWK